MALKNVGAGWKKKTKANENMLSLSIDLGNGKVNLYVFKVREKKTDKSPDYSVCIRTDDPIPQTRVEEAVSASSENDEDW